MNYKIIKFDEQLGRITVLPEGFDPIDIDLPLNENNEVYEGEQLQQYITGFLPIYHVDRMNALLFGITNAESIRNLVEPSDYVEPPTVTNNLTDDLKLYILSVLREEGLIQ